MAKTEFLPAKKTERPSGLVWEQPLGTVRGQLDEPGPRFVDPYQAEERDAIEWVEGCKQLDSRSAATTLKRS